MEDTDFIVVRWENSPSLALGLVKVPSMVDLDLATVRAMIESQVEAISVQRLSAGPLAFDYRFLMPARELDKLEQSKKSPMATTKKGAPLAQAYVPIGRNQESEMLLSDLLFSSDSEGESSTSIVLRQVRQPPSSATSASKCMWGRCCFKIMLGVMLLAAAALAVHVSVMGQHPRYQHGQHGSCGTSQEHGPWMRPGGPYDHQMTPPHHGPDRPWFHDQSWWGHPHEDHHRPLDGQLFEKPMPGFYQPQPPPPPPMLPLPPATFLIIDVPSVSGAGELEPQAQSVEGAYAGPPMMPVDPLPPMMLVDPPMMMVDVQDAAAANQEEAMTMAEDTMMRMKRMKRDEMTDMKMKISYGDDAISAEQQASDLLGVSDQQQQQQWPIDGPMRPPFGGFLPPWQQPKVETAPAVDQPAYPGLGRPDVHEGVPYGDDGMGSGGMNGGGNPGDAAGRPEMDSGRNWGHPGWWRDGDRHGHRHHGCHHHDEHDADPSASRPWERVVMAVVITVGSSVQGYFRTFSTCWKEMGTWFVRLIDAYVGLLTFLIDRMLQWPVVIVLVVAVAVALHYAERIIQVLLPYRDGTVAGLRIPDHADGGVLVYADEHQECPELKV